jgi:hypothetical protein
MRRRLIAGVLVIALGLAGCGTPESAEAVVTTVTTTARTVEIAIPAETTTKTTTATTKAATTTTAPETTTAPPTETTTETTEEPEPTTFVDVIFECIETKNVNELKYRMGYCEGEDGWLYNVTFESFEEVEELKYRDNIYGYLVKITISESSDPRFPVGESFCSLIINDAINSVESFIEIDDTGDYRKQLHEYYDITASDRALMLAYSFEHAFNLFSDIPDMSDLGDYLETTDYYSRCTIQHLPIIMGIDEYTELTQEYVDTWYNRFFGITEQPYDFLEIYRTDIYELYPTLYVLDLSWKAWDNAGYGWRLDEQTDSTITITFFGDRCYLTPAKTMKYSYEINDGIPRLLSSEVIEDFGYEPYMMDFY